MNSRQGARYIKRRMGNDLKKQILVYNGVLAEETIHKEPSVSICPRCTLTNALDNKYCSKCSYPLIPSAFDEIKAEEEAKIQTLKDKYEQDMKTMREEMNQQFTQIMSMIQQNSQLAYIKPEALTTKKVNLNT